MSLESQVAALTTATTDLLEAVNTSKATLDQAVTDAETQVGLAEDQAALAAGHASTANTKAGEASGSAAQALAIYGNTAAVNTAVATAQAQASLAAGFAASAGSVAQQDLSGVNAGLHRSPNAITAMFLYDTSKDSDGGAFTEKLGYTSLVREALNGKWLGAQATESAARAVSGAATGDYFQLTIDGKIYKLNSSSGTTQVYRGNKASIPKVMALIAESLGLFIYDLTESGRPLWRHFPVGANEIIFVAPTCITAIQSIIAVGSASGMSVIDIAKDKATKITTAADQVYKRSLAIAGAGWAQ